jgi:alkanesulfonate monooxygenase SsuD/methylene tetrahydromethanopterin reductase-like flavin-dependent oxidoreductase (luciferase family)
MQVGLVVMDEDPADALTIVRAADRAGIHSLWSIDYYNRSSLTRAAAFAAVSETAIVGTSVTPLFARAPLALAAAAADVQGIAGGRFVLGVGSSTRRMNQDWYGTALRHPAPQVRERIELIRRLTAHRSGPFRYEGQFDQVSMAHYDRTALPDSLTILAAGVGEHMVRVAGECADGFVGHTIASAGYLRDTARPLLAEGAARAGRDVAGLRMTTQIVSAASSDPRAARRDAAAQVGFYSTPKGYDALFPDGQFAAERIAARDALARGDVAGVIAAGEAMVEERAVFGTPEDVAGQLRRYADVVDWAILYPPHFGVDPERIHANELSLVVLMCATEACTNRHVRCDRSWPARRRDSRSRRGDDRTAGPRGRWPTRGSGEPPPPGRRRGRRRTGRVSSRGRGLLASDDRLCSSVRPHRDRWAAGRGPR